MGRNMHGVETEKLVALQLQSKSQKHKESRKIHFGLNETKKVDISQIKKYVSKVTTMSLHYHK